MEEALPDLNIFMLCGRADTAAFRAMPSGFRTRLCRPEELALWKRMHFDGEEMATAYAGYMDAYYDRVYAPQGALFFQRCLFAVDGQDAPLGTCFAWQAYGRLMTIHWLKVIKGYEGRGIGRALLTEVMQGIAPYAYPVLLHTQPSSYRAIKLYADFGFALVTDERVGMRHNDLEACLPILKEKMPAQAFESLRFTRAPENVLAFLATQHTDEF